MIDSLKNISLKSALCISNLEKLSTLLDTDILLKKQKDIIISKFLTDKDFIMFTVENHPSVLEGIKYKLEILEIYDQLKNTSTFNMMRYIDNMREIGDISNFNYFDQSFLWYILYRVITGRNIINDTYDISGSYHIFNEFKKTNLEMRMVGILRVIEFNLNVDDYLTSWFFTVIGNVTLNSYKCDYDDILLNCRYVFILHGVDYGVHIMLKKNLTFLIHTKRYVSDDDYSVSYISGIIKYVDDKYTVEKYW